MPQNLRQGSGQVRFDVRYEKTKKYAANYPKTVQEIADMVIK